MRSIKLAALIALLVFISFRFAGVFEENTKPGSVNSHLPDQFRKPSGKPSVQSFLASGKDTTDATGKLIKSCLPLSSQALSTDVTLTDLVDKIRSSSSTVENVEVENFHVLTGDKTEYRLMISPSKSVDDHGLEAKFFSVDRDGLPKIEKLPDNIDPSDIERAKKNVLDLGALTFHETVLVLKDEANKVSGRVTYTGEKISQAELFEDGHFLGCAVDTSDLSPHCKCL